MRFSFNRDPLVAAFRGTFRRFHGPLVLEKGKALNENFLKLVSAVEADEGWMNLRQVAYAAATTYHETGRDFDPKEEHGRGRGKPYGQSVPVMGTGGRVANSQAYHGRGLVQLTWLQNNARASLICGVDMVTRPERAMQGPDCHQPDQLARHARRRHDGRRGLHAGGEARRHHPERGLQ
jgi:hypothetical protein